MRDSYLEPYVESLEFCVKCESPATHWSECHQCGGEGSCSYDVGTQYSAEPEQVYEECDECYGLGGWFFCRACKGGWT